MAVQFEYRICTLQNNRVTFVNGEWQGTVTPAADDPNEAWNSCPTVWEYLNDTGRDGWELVTALSRPAEEAQVQTAFLKRSIPE